MSRIEDALLEAARVRNAKGQHSPPDAEAHADAAPASVAERNGQGKKPFSKFLSLSAGALLLLVFSGSYLYLGSYSHPSRPEPASAPQPTPERNPRLPAVLGHTTADPTYSRTHPGWERFHADQLEYRVFRKKNRVQAVQVIALTEQGISHQQFNSLLAEIVGGDTYRINSAEKKEEFMLEKGSGENGHELLICRKTSNGQIRGFVASFTKPQ